MNAAVIKPSRARPFSDVISISSDTVTEFSIGVGILASASLRWLAIDIQFFSPSIFCAFIIVSLFFFFTGVFFVTLLFDWRWLCLVKSSTVDRDRLLDNMRGCFFFFFFFFFYRRWKKYINFFYPIVWIFTYNSSFRKCRNFRATFCNDDVPLYL